jgi:hypothetical protein
MMRWITYSPKDRDTRKLKRFAFFPVELDFPKITVWLEFYYEKQTYHTYRDCWYSDVKYPIDRDITEYDSKASQKDSK